MRSQLGATLMGLGGIAAAFAFVVTLEMPFIDRHELHEQASMMTATLLIGWALGIGMFAVGYLLNRMGRGRTRDDDRAVANR